VTVASYAPPCYVHPSRYGAVKTRGANRLLIIHDSEGSEGTASALNLCGFMGTAGSSTNVASYHAVTDLNMLVRPAVPDNVVAYSAAGANHDGVHICIPGKIAQTREQWLDPVTRSYIKTCAAWLVDKSVQHGIPLVRLSVADVVAGKRGYCDHRVISQAYKRSTHTDVGGNFPWDVLADDIQHYGSDLPDVPDVPDPPAEEFDMGLITRHPTTRQVYVLPVGLSSKTPIDDDRQEALMATNWYKVVALDAKLLDRIPDAALLAGGGGGGWVPGFVGTIALTPQV
jgi:hypothetical protein